MKHGSEINEKNLKTLCWKRGFSVKGLADHIGKHRVTVHRAVRFPKKFTPTYKQICEVLHA